MDVNHRIRIFLKQKKITVQNFESLIGKTNGYLSHTKSPTAGVVADIMKVCPDLNIEWLLTGEGPMFKGEPIEASDSSYEAIRLKDEVNSLKEELKESYKEIGRLEGENNLLREQLRLGDRKNEKSA